MSTSRKPVLLWLALIAALAAGGVLAFVDGDRASGPQLQPIAFNHKRHLEEGMNCADCHKGAQEGPHATLPSLKACLLCHSEPKGNHPDEPKIREYAAKSEAIPWVQVNRLPGHVYFSHTAHVTYAKMDCRECHGEMKDRTEPATTSQISELDMDRCMECHTEKGVSLDCLRCHK